MDDLAAAAFETAWRRWPVPEPALPWLLTTARNLLLNELRTQRRRPTVCLELARTASDARAQAAPEQRVAARALLAAVCALPEHEREALLLVAWDGLSPRQAAQVCGCAPATLRARLFRGRRRLAASLSDAEDPTRLEKASCPVE